MVDFSPDYAAAIRAIETGGNANPYAVIGKGTTRKDGSLDLPHGAYQIMGSNIPQWTEDVLGVRMTPQELMSHPETKALQDKIFAAKFGDALTKYGTPQDAANVWFTGRPQSAGTTAPDVLGTTPNQYVSKFNAALAKQNGPMAAAFAEQQPPMDRMMAFAPQGDTDVPPNATPTAGSIPPNALPANGGADKMGLLTNNMGDLGVALMALSNPGAAQVMSGQLKDTRSQSQLQAAQQATIKALVQNGMAPQDAAAIALNPDAAKMLSKTPVDFGTNPLSGKKDIRLLNPLTGKWVPAGTAGAVAVPTGGPLSDGSTAPGAADFDISRVQDAYNKGVPAEQLRSMIPKSFLAEADNIAKGGLGSVNFSRKGGYQDTMMMLTQMLHPDFAAFDYDVRKKANSDFAPGGKNAMRRQSLEMVGGHIGTLIDAEDTINKNKGLLPDMPAVNGVRNWINTAVGKDTTTAYERAATGIAGELSTLFRSVGQSTTEIHEWRDKLSPNMSHQQFLTSTETLLDMIKSRREALAEDFKQTGKPADKLALPKLDQAIAKLEAARGPSSPKQEAPVRKTLGSKTYIQKNGQWFEE